MTTSSRPPARALAPSQHHAAVDGLRRSAVFVGVGVGMSALLVFGGIGLPCPFRLATGWRCPLCGSTTMGAHLLQGDLAGAWAANGFVLLALVLVVLVDLVWLAEVLSRRRVFPPGWPGSLDRWLLAGAVAGVVFQLARGLG